MGDGLDDFLEENAKRLAEQGIVVPPLNIVTPAEDEDDDPGYEILPGGEVALREAKKNEADLQTEGAIVDQLRSNAKSAAEIEATLLERVGNITEDEQLPSALRAVADVKNKSIDGLIKLTGRDGQDAGDDFAQMLRGMAEAGFLKLNVQLEIGQEQTSND